MAGLPAQLVGVRCPIDLIMRRRYTGQDGRDGEYATSGPAGEIPEPVRQWQAQVHLPGIYDLEVDSSVMSPEEAALVIRDRMAGSAPTALARLTASRV